MGGFAVLGLFRVLWGFLGKDWKGEYAMRVDMYSRLGVYCAIA